MNRREIVLGSAAMLAALSSSSCQKAETPQDKAERLHAALLCLILNKAFRDAFHGSGAPGANSPLGRVYAQDSSLYSAVRANYLSGYTPPDPFGQLPLGADDVLFLFSDLFFKTANNIASAKQDVAVLTINPYGDQSLCPCSGSAAKCGFVERLIS